MGNIRFNFFNVHVFIQSSEDSITSCLAKDFSIFESQQEIEKPDVELKINKVSPPFELIPRQVASMQTNNSLCYDTKDCRYCDYYGEALVIDHHRAGRGELYGTKSEKLHEIAYLYILSKVGKKLDLMGLHKVHAFGVAYKETAVVCMMPMKGGKSTLLLEFLKDSDYKIISDDIPLVNFKGEVMPFPIKIGMNHPFSVGNIKEDSEFFYTMDRGVYGIKHLLSLKAISERIVPINARFNKIVLINAQRFRGHESSLIKISKTKMLKNLFKHGVIGFGLPMVVEYFWQFGIKDFMVKTLIFMKRLLAFSVLSAKSKNYTLHLGTSPSAACAEISKLVKNV